MADNTECVIDIFRPGDAAGVVALYRAVYGDDYPVKSVYDPAELIRQSAGDAYRTVARTAAGEVVGHMALYRSSSPNPNLYEVGQWIVRPDYRRAGLGFRMHRHLLEELPVLYGLEQIWGEAVCNHLITQQLVAGEGFYATALEVDLMPGEAYTKAGTGNHGRVSTLVVSKTFKPKPQTVYLPPAYAEVLRYLYSAYEFGLKFVPGGEDFADNSVTRGKVDIFAGAGVTRITLPELGGDFFGFMRQAEQKAREADTIVSQVFLPLSRPCIGPAVDYLRGSGYFLGGVIPRWFDNGGFLMQKLLTEPNWDGIKLYNRQAENILELVRNDWHNAKKVLAAL